MNLLSTLTYISYASNRDEGMTHKSLVRLGIGNDNYKLLYDNNFVPKAECTLEEAIESLKNE